MKTERIGKIFLQMDDDHKLPEYYNNFPFYDRALPRIAKIIKKIDGELFFMDIGANIGDTVSLVSSEVKGNFLCVEGDPEYLRFLQANVKDIKKSQFFVEKVYCGERQIKRGKVIKENGTARIERNENEIELKIKALDEIIKKNSLFYKTNLLKIDTDGLEVSVLRSGKDFLSRISPVIYFEFDPEFYKNNNFGVFEAFNFLLRLGYEEGLFYDNFGLPRKIVSFNDHKKIQELIEKIDKKEIFYFDILTFHKSKKEKYQKIFEEELLSQILTLNNFYISSKTTQIELISTREQLASTQAELTSVKEQLIFNQTELERVYNSREWQAIMKIQRIFKLIFPIDSLRRKMLVKIFRLVKITWRVLLKIKRKLQELFLQIRNNLIKIKPKKRKINLNSKKIVFIDHSYHQKTGSANFMLEYLKDFFEVEVIFDESWCGKGEKFPDLSFIDESYLGVIFWQVLPNKNILKRIKNDNLIYFPMYDQSGRLEWEFWKNYRDLKIINFSYALHKKLKKWGFESIYIQYFPPVGEFFPGKKEEAFFWQRLTPINFSIVKKVFGDLAIKIHLHKAVDPDQKFIQPTKEDEEKFQISYSDWFENRAEMLEIVKNKAIYVAPREYEGIGMSFLEAMAMGKAVVAVDNPTMNEYIKSGWNGYLFDLKKPKALDFSQLEIVQKNAYEYMKQGREKWEKEKGKIIDFIKKI